MIAALKINWGWFVLIAGRQGVFLRLCGKELDWESAGIVDLMPIFVGSLAILWAIYAWSKIWKSTA